MYTKDHMQSFKRLSSFPWSRLPAANISVSQFTFTLGLRISVGLFSKYPQCSFRRKIENLKVIKFSNCSNPSRIFLYLILFFLAPFY